jgi:hypothetical protein
MFPWGETGKASAESQTSGSRRFLSKSPDFQGFAAQQRPRRAAQNRLSGRFI